MFVAAGILLSRVSGLVREKVFAHYFGNSDAAGVYKAAIRIPNVLQNMLGEGVLSASFIPVYARLHAEGKEELAGRVAGVTVTILALVVAIVVLLGVILTPYLLWVIAPGYEGAVRDLTIVVVRILFPGIGLLVLYAWCIGIMNTHGKFFLAYAAPVLMNIAVIVTMVLFAGRLAPERAIMAVAWGNVVGAALQLGLQIPFVFRYGKYMRFALDTALEPVREVFRNFLPVVGSRGVVQLSAWLDNLIATLLGTAAVAGLGYAQMIYLLPVSLFGMSVAAAELPEMSRQVGTDEEVLAALRKRMQRGLRQISFFVIPSVVAFLAIGNVLVAALYQGGKFKAEDTLFVWYILIGSTVGLLAMSLGRLYSSAFYALRDPKTPLRIAMFRVILGGGLGWLMAIPLRPFLIAALEAMRVPLPLIGGSTKALGAIGLTAASGLAGWIEFMLLRGALAKRGGVASVESSYLIRLWAAAIPAGVAGALFYRFITPRIASYLPDFLPHIRDGIIVCGIFGIVYFATGIVLGVPEARATLGRFLLRSKS